jgi:hypothetical protein
MATLVGLLALLTGLALRTTEARGTRLSLLWLGLGALLTVAALILQGRRFRRTHYRRESWQRRDTLVTLASMASIVVVALAQAWNPQALAYYPYPPLSPWPRFAIGVGLAAALLAAPAQLWPRVALEPRQASRQDTG